MTLNRDVTNGELKLRPVAGGLKEDLESQFFACLFLSATAMGKHPGSKKKVKARLFLNRSSEAD